MINSELLQSKTLFKLALTVNLVSVVWNIVSDCDETYNYWEPLHFIINGKGFQTWEYSPIYCLRSYLYLLIYGWPAIILKMIFQTISNRLLFYIIRIYMATITSLLEFDLYRNFKSYLKNANEFTVPIYSLIILLLSAGSFIASTAFLPSSFAFYCSMLALSQWLRNNYNGMIAAIAASTILGWPFSAAIGIPFAIDLLLFQRKFSFFIKSAAFWGVFFTTFSLLIDSLFYGRIAFPSLNIVTYNVFSSHGGPELYGVEDTMFYVKNYLLNFNIAIPMALLSVPVVTFDRNLPTVGKLNRVAVMSMSVLIVWNLIFFLQAHKEERFLFPCYPFVAVSAGIALFHCQSIFNKFSFGKFFHKHTFAVGFIVVFSVISVSRILAIILSFSAPTALYSHFNDIANREGKLLCLGREWHRFPSSFLVTGSSNLNISFIQSDFKGQLPGKFFQSDIFKATRDNRNQMFNDRNQEEKSRYVDLTSCDFIVDRIDGRPQTANEPNWELLSSMKWRPVMTYKLLTPFSTGSKSSVFRSFYIPILFERYNQFVDYVVFEKFV